MGNLNKAMLIGRLGAKPEKRQTGSGLSVATLNIATTEYFNDKSGQRRERTEWLRVVLWDKLADLAEMYLDKGSQVYIEGRIQTREWQDKEGQKRYTTEIVGQQLQFLDSKPQQGGGGQGYGSPQGGGQGFGSPQGGQGGGDYYGEPTSGYSPPQQSGGQSYGQNAPDQPRGGGMSAPSQGDDFIEDDVPF